MNFGDNFKKLRMRKKMTLRHFCELNGFDPGNISRLERGVFPAPRSEDKLNLYASALDIKPGDDEYLTFVYLSIISNLEGNVRGCASELLDMSPVFLRTADNSDIISEKLERIITLIKDEIKK